MELKDML